jgi:hypothetical protein
MRLAHAELRDLFQRQRTIRRRVSCLSRILADLQNDTSSSDNLIADSPFIAQRRCGRDTSRDNLSVSPDVEGSATDPSYKLRRACRLALLELEEPGTAEDICSRIMRREAFLFAVLGSAVADVVCVLDSMSRCGEARLVDGGPCPRWMRIVRQEPPTSQTVGVGRRARDDSGALPAAGNSTALIPPSTHAIASPSHAPKY